ncbi:MAG: hypothetical protein QM722_05185 [Piscinibacter sp.]
MTEFSHTIRIKKDAPRCLVFEVASSSGGLLARSAPYASICKLEAGLTVLRAAAESAEAAAVETDGATTWVRPGDRRSRVALKGMLSTDLVAQVLAGLPSAVIVDDRPPSERRADLSGQFCDLAH